MSEHTPTPWEVQNPMGDDWWIVQAGLEAYQWSCIATVRDDTSEDVFDRGASKPISRKEAKANAAFIVKAVNLHDELVGALKGYIDLIRSDYEGRGGKINSSFAEEYDKLNVLLAKADLAEKTP